MSDLARIFAMDPLDLTNEDIDKIIADLRDRRHKFNSGATQAGAVTPKLTERQSVAKKLLDNKELDLDI